MFNLFKFFSDLRAQKKHHWLLNKPSRQASKFKAEYPNYSIGAHCYGIPKIKHPHPNAVLKIGAYCSIAKNVQIFMGGNHRTDWISTYPFPIFYHQAEHIKDSHKTRGDILIGNDVWLCENCTILSGVTIGDGAVVANGALVTKDIAPYEIVGGNPAKHIKWRFDEITRQALLGSAWWNWPEVEVLSVVELICSEDVSAFLRYVEARKS